MVFEPSRRWAPSPGCNDMGIMGKCLTTILSLAVTVVSKLRLRNNLELTYKPEA